MLCLGMNIWFAVFALVTAEIPFHMESTTHAIAETRCQEEGRHLGLPCPQSQKEHQHLVRHMSDLNLTSIHLSLKRTREPEFRWVDGTPFTGDLRARSEEMCAEILRNATLIPSTCVSNDTGALCQYDEKPGQVDYLNCYHDNDNWFCVQFPFANWYHARATCRAFGGDLAGINITKKQSWPPQLLSPPMFPSVHSFYVGLYRANWSCHFMDKEPRPLGLHLPWETDEPTSSEDADCAVLQTTTRQTGSWRAVRCDQKEAAMCQPYGKPAREKESTAKVGIIAGIVVGVVILTVVSSIFIYKCLHRNVAEDGQDSQARRHSRQKND